ncbi:hypothetical protein OG562_37005 [Streptomyces sp. NBC_01275]|uniref:hypothetical protein n=1 Tax=Streptomyces sp. NBC_01275 TaxID=2903807 RepID=UPI00224E39B4|nr:hypothetical protein [Streptomyces sp. NBC_01275]MCX4766478.1 hypothetical protein [Streptomyces sp. NBC_01275]
MSPAPVRFRDPRVTQYDYVSSMLVRCPRCERVAHYECRPGRAPDAHGVIRSERRLVCRSCGLSRISSGPSKAHSGGQPCRPSLWLRAETRHGVVWAYNLEHLDLLRRFVAASLRERAPWYDTGRKMTLIARLPAWIKSAKNRTEVLRALDRLRASVTAV